MRNGLGVAAWTRLAWATPALVAAAFACPIAMAGDFTFELDSPNFRVTLPNVPPMNLGPHPMSSTNAALRVLGSEGPYTVSVITPSAEAGMGAAECASSLVGSLPKRPGVPAQSQIYKGRINDRNFIALYAAPADGAVHLHAHLVSAIGANCIEVHVSKISTSQDDLKTWFKGWDSARIEPTERKAP